MEKTKFPSGPTPLPFLGNIIGLYAKGMNSCKALHLWPKQFPNLFTFWFGSMPALIVCNWDLIKDALVTQKNNFSGRRQGLTTKLFQEEFCDVIVGDFGPAWLTLRKIGFSAIRKYADNEKLAVLISDVVDQSTTIMLREEGQFNPTDHMFLTVYNVIASTAFGRRYEMDDPEFLHLKSTNIRVSENTFLVGDNLPKLRYLFYYQEIRLKKLIGLIKSVISEKYEEHKKTYVTGVIRDFTDAILAAKEEAELESSDSLEYMIDGNLKMLLLDLFNAGIDTTRIVLMWCFLYLANYPKTQEKLREEVINNIGDRIPLQSDKNNCPHVQSFISEVLRMKPVINFTLDHTATVDTELGGYKVTKGTSIMAHILAQHMNPIMWDEPEKFKPERFLREDGTFNQGKITGFMPFGMGRRACLGEKLARADLFLLLAGFLQKIKFKLPAGPGTADFEPKYLIFMNQPKDFQLVVEQV